MLKMWWITLKYTSKKFEDLCTCTKWLFMTRSDFTQGLDDPRRQPNGRRPAPCWLTSRTSHRTGRRRRRSKTRRRRTTFHWWAGSQGHKNKSDTVYMLIVAPSFLAPVAFAEDFALRIIKTQYYSYMYLSKIEYFFFNLPSYKYNNHQQGQNVHK